MKRVGERFKLVLEIADGQNVGTVGGHITYDPTLVKLVDANPSVPNTQAITSNLGYISDAIPNVALRRIQNQETPGYLVVAYGSTNLTPGNGNGDCFDVEFEAIAPGTVRFDFVQSENLLSDVMNNPLASIFEGTELRIEAVQGQVATVSLRIV